jgi:hypothetical protein
MYSRNNIIHTNLEETEINMLYHVTKEKHSKFHIKDIDNITHDMVYSLYHDDRVNKIYNKSIITKEVLKKIFIHETGENKIVDDHKKIVDNIDTQIYKSINYHENKKKKRTSCNCNIL